MMLTHNITYQVNAEIEADDYICLLQKTWLGQRRPIQDLQGIKGMLKHSNLMVFAWVDSELIGISRAVRDFYYCCYLSDLAVAESYQKQGGGKKLIDLTAEQLQPNCKIILLAAPQATDYYPHIGFEQHPSAWVKTYA